MISFSEQEFAPFYARYLNLANKENTIILGLNEELKNTVSFFESIPVNKLEFKYAEGKWSIKDILLHLIDTERIFTYRALRIARNDTTELPGFEENDYVHEAKADFREIKSLIEEYIAVRKATLNLFSSFSNEDLFKIGKASNATISVRAIGYIIQGHEIHHINIIKQRYL